jgi:hypothetical protein
LRYYEDENEEMYIEPFAIKKTHINTQKKRRYYVDGEMTDYFKKVVFFK